MMEAISIGYNSKYQLCMAFNKCPLCSYRFTKKINDVVRAVDLFFIFILHVRETHGIPLEATINVFKKEFCEK
jgi:hypothetical protein